MIGALAAYWIYSAAFVSVWCFFAAVLSLTIYAGLRGSSPSKAPLTVR